MDDDVLGDLLGYLLDALPDEDRVRLEARLAESEALRSQLEALRLSVSTLALDRECDEPPAELAFRTLQKIVAHSCRITRVAPPPPEGATGSSGWRRADVFIAASVLLVVGALSVPVVLHLQHQSAILACANNMRMFHASILRYANDNQEELPGPSTKEPLSRAGTYSVKLRDHGYWDSLMGVDCPANRRGRSPMLPPRAQDLKGGKADITETYRRQGGCYGYNLGHLDERGRPCNLRMTMSGPIPLVADRPYRPNESPHWQTQLSPNHGGQGQNVLYLAGNVMWETSRLLDDDDIFANRLGKQAIGFGAEDRVLAPSEVSITPEGGDRE
jgi:hypothetical protein